MARDCAHDKKNSDEKQGSCMPSYYFAAIASTEGFDDGSYGTCIILLLFRPCTFATLVCQPLRS